MKAVAVTVLALLAIFVVGDLVAVLVALGPGGIGAGEIAWRIVVVAAAFAVTVTLLVRRTARG